VANPRYFLSPQPRPRSLLHLEAAIGHAEAACTRLRVKAEGLEAAGRDGRQPRGLLAVAEERLAHLNRSREVLLGGEEGYEAAEPA
jgi:hypothetical protein